MNGVLNVNKPAGITSHDVVAQARRIGGIRRVGHAGTLDPMATGVLVLGVGVATRLLEYVVGQPKSYLATIRLGETTDSYDADGEVVATAPVTVSPQDVKEALAPFRGEIMQIPPIYSAIKRDGKPLYKLARAGKKVELSPRPVTIYDLTLLDCQLPAVTIQVSCGAGTYIRSLAHDLGQSLGCGGHLATLQRTAIGSFRVADGVSLAQLQAEGIPPFLQPLDRAVQHLPAIKISQAEAIDLGFGRQIVKAEGAKKSEIHRVYAPDGRFVGLVMPKEQHWQPHKIFLSS